MLWQLILAALLIWAVVMHRRSRKYRLMRKQFKSDWQSFPFTGDAHHFMGGGEIRMSSFQKLGRMAFKYEGWSKVYLGSLFFGYAADPLEAEYIMKNHLEKDDILKISQNLIGNGLIFAPVSIWRPRRKVMAPTFTQYNLNQFVDIFYRQSTIMGDNLSQVADGRTIGFWKYIVSYTMDSVCQTTLGVDMGVQKTSDHVFLHHFKQYASIMVNRLFQPFIQSDVGFKYFCYFGQYSLVAKSLKVLKGFVNDIIDKKRQSLKNPESNVEKTENRNFKPILELLIEASGGEKGYTNKELEEETLVLLVAGTDTSAVGSAFVALMLAKYPELQEKVYREIQDVLGDSDRPIKAEDLPKLSYLEAFVKETLRLYPPVPITARKIVKEDVTPAGMKLYPGMGILICHWAIQRNPKYWGEDAEEFRPERFFDSPPTHPSAFVPFASGPRSCLGYKYAMMSMMTSTANLVRRYRLLPPNNEKLTVSYEIMMKDANDFQLKLEPRR